MSFEGYELLEQLRNLTPCRRCDGDGEESQGHECTLCHGTGIDPSSPTGTKLPSLRRLTEGLEAADGLRKSKIERLEAFPLMVLFRLPNPDEKAISIEAELKHWRVQGIEPPAFFAALRKLQEDALVLFVPKELAAMPKQLCIKKTITFDSETK